MHGFGAHWFQYVIHGCGHFSSGGCANKYGSTCHGAIKDWQQEVQYLQLLGRGLTEKPTLCKSYPDFGYCCGSDGRAVASDVRGPRFESSQLQTIILDINLFTVSCNEKAIIKKKRPRMDPF